MWLTDENGDENGDSRSSGHGNWRPEQLHREESWQTAAAELSHKLSGGESGSTGLPYLYPDFVESGGC